MLGADESARLITTMPTQVSASAAAPGLDFEQPLVLSNAGEQSSRGAECYLAESPDPIIDLADKVH